MSALAIAVLVRGILPDSLASYYFTVGPAFAHCRSRRDHVRPAGHGGSVRLSTGYRLADFLDRSPHSAEKRSR
jgi:hypothetical protein